MRAEGGIGRRGKGRARRAGAALAIAALFLELLVTAGHFHADDFGFLANSAPVSASAVHGRAPGDAQPGAPAHDDCALCFTLYLAGAAAPPDIPLLAAPGEQLVALTPVLLEAPRRAAGRYLLFRTRAPPVA